MGIANLLTSESINKGLIVSHGRHYKFKLSRFIDTLGFHIYLLENLRASERIFIKRHLFDRFRATLRDLISSPEFKDNNSVIDIQVRYEKYNVFSVKSDGNDQSKIIIREIEPRKGSTGIFTISKEALRSLDELLYLAKVDHPNDVLERIIDYHRIFQFTFNEATTSITSDLGLKKNVLYEIKPFVPALGKRLSDASKEQAEIDTLEAPEGRVPKINSGDNKSLFKSRLGERSVDANYQINYEDLFGGQTAKLFSQSHKSDGPKKQTNVNSFSIPLHANEIKSFSHKFFKVELTTEEVDDLRSRFLQDRDSEFFLGFEILDAVFKKDSGQFSSFQFPLYYLKVRINESGRQIIIDPSENGKIYLNHLALCNLIEKFVPAHQTGEKLKTFFADLLAQSFEVEGNFSRIFLTRLLPCNDSVFDRTRDILLGFHKESGKGGLLSFLKVMGIEADLESVHLYKSPKVKSPIASALEFDLESIRVGAKTTPSRFYKSLLGKFLSPEVRRFHHEKIDRFAKTLRMPGQPTRSTKTLFAKLNEHDLVLLAGPPGTGKTFTIMNLLIHCLCEGKRILIVSDQEAAIHALIEKFMEYLIPRNTDVHDRKAKQAVFEAAVKIVDRLPPHDKNLAHFANELKDMLKLEQQIDLPIRQSKENWDEKISTIEAKIAKRKWQIQKHMEWRLGKDANIRRRVTPKTFHETTDEDISSLVTFLKFINNRSQSADSPLDPHQLMYRFIKDREFLVNSDIKDCYSFFEIPESIRQDHVDKIDKTILVLENLLKHKPRTESKFLRIMQGCPQNGVTHFIGLSWYKKYPRTNDNFLGAMRAIGRLFYHPIMRQIRQLHSILLHQKHLFKYAKNFDKGLWRQLSIIHSSLIQSDKKPVPLSLEICRFSLESTIKKQNAVESHASIQEILEDIERLMRRRNRYIKSQVESRLYQYATAAHNAQDHGGTSPLTSIQTSLESLKSFTNIEAGASVFDDLREKLLETFPVWLCRKQAVSFLFPCREQIFDLVIVDEATQCRVDDALPLLYRAKKLMVVGDEKQTVLAKNSVVDDYLFDEFGLEEHLRFTQARGIKGGGSHIFGLVKGIKQASVMLDEHFRCPPEIIEFSNRYVYNNELRIMKWNPIGSRPSVHVDYSEKRHKGDKRAESGKYKSIETGMIDRYFDYVGSTVLTIEKETGRKINMATDVALCYFLLKNEPYIKDKKAEFLRSLNRGDEVLDGAGAALQGKERDYIFYLWDVTRGNHMAFRQGDEEDKRKGELNVLMSRPKMGSYHFLHRDFDKLDHKKSTITDYLWDAFHKQSQKSHGQQFAARWQRPGPEFIPWRRSSGQLMAAIIDAVLYGKKSDLGAKYSQVVYAHQYSVTVGNPKQMIDLMLVADPKAQQQLPSIGVVDLCGFEANEDCADHILDYYFQLLRASPPVKPVFLFMHELADERSRAFQRLEKAVAKLKGPNKTPKAS